MKLSISNFKNIYKNAEKSGIKSIVVDYLGLDPLEPMPLVFPHAIDYYQAKILCDLHCHEPLYVATRVDIYEKAKLVREAIEFPHPWLFLIDGVTLSLGLGTLFIASDPGLESSEKLYKGIQAGDFIKPWGVLLKDRGLLTEDVNWWQDRGFQTHCAGNHTNPTFFQDLKGILTRYDQVATAHFTSAAFFAASLSMSVRIVEDVCLDGIAPLDYGQINNPNYTNDVDEKIKKIWIRLTSSDSEVSRMAALEHLGINFMKTKDELKSQYYHAVSNIKRPIHLYPIESEYIYRVILKLISLGIPIQRCYPFPVRKLMTRFSSYLGFNFCLKVRVADFHDFGIIENKGYYSEEYFWFWSIFVTRQNSGTRFLPRSSFKGIGAMIKKYLKAIVKLD